LSNGAALLVIDVQEAFNDPSWGLRNNPQCESNIARLQQYWREKDGVVLHVQHVSDDVDSLFYRDSPGGVAFQPWTQPLPDEPVFEKMTDTAFIHTGLHRYLIDNDLHRLVVVGFTTPHGISSTVRLGAELGFNITVVEDATAAFSLTDWNGICYNAEQVHQFALAEMFQTFADVRTTKELTR
jgi:Amidases related to nicotinamidase